MRFWAEIVGVLACAMAACAVRAQETDADIAKQLSNPVANIISVPFQGNYDCCFGTNNNSGRFTLNIQPVIPITLNDNWTLITRTIGPIIDQQASPSVGSAAGLGDITQSFFLSPKPTASGIIWGAGPVFLWPTGTAQLGSAKWGAGPTFVILKQQGPITFGLLANQIWSYAGNSGRPNVSRLFLQPFYAYQLPDSTTLNLNTEAGYDWELRQWTVPIDLGISHVFKIAGAPVSLGATGKIYVVSPDQQPGWGLRLTATLIIPKK